MVQVMWPGCSLFGVSIASSALRTMLTMQVFSAEVSITRVALIAFRVRSVLHPLKKVVKLTSDFFF